jgi:hypothetical protein
MNKKPRNPYIDLLKEEKDYASKIKYPHTIYFTKIPKKGVEKKLN